MPAEGVPQLGHADILTYEEIRRFVDIAADAGITKVRITGGEPLVRKGVAGMIGSLTRSRPTLDLSLTTNGLLLSRFAPELKEAGLARVNISIDSLDPETFRKLTRGGDLERALEGLRSALDIGLHPVKLNVVLLKGINDSPEELGAFMRLAREEPVFVRFIEYMNPLGEMDASHFVSVDRVTRILRSFGEIRESDAPFGAGPARYLELEGMRGKIGLISPVSSHFCLTCNRLRLTSDGKLKSCLLSDSEVDVRALLRSDAGDGQILDAIRSCLAAKPLRHGGRNGDFGQKMSRIGG